jgi:hypothetical protein
MQRNNNLQGYNCRVRTQKDIEKVIHDERYYERKILKKLKSMGNICAVAQLKQ